MRHRPLGPTLTRAIAREIAVVAAVLTAVFGFVALLTEWLVFGQALGRGGGADAVTSWALEAGIALQAALPFASGLAVLLVAGRWSADRERDALAQCGVGPFAWWRPVGVVAVAAAVVAGVGSLWSTPASERALQIERAAWLDARPWDAMEPGHPMAFGAWRLAAESVRVDGSLARVRLFSPTLGDTLFARTGRLWRDPERGVGLELENGRALLAAGGAQELHFDALTLSLPAPVNWGGARNPADAVRGHGFAALATLVVGPDPRLAVAARRERQRRWAEPLWAFGWTLAAWPLALATRVRSRMRALGVGVAALAGSFAAQALGAGVAQAGLVGHGASVWTPHALLLLAGVAWRGRVRFGARTPSRRAASPARDGERHAVAFRSGILTRHIAARFLVLVGLSFGALFVFYLGIDFLERLAWFARHAAEPDEVARFYAARAPLLAARVVPFAMLAAAALLVGALAADGELVGLRASGVSGLRALAPVFVLTWLAVPGYFLLRDQVVPRTNAHADYLKRTEIKAPARSPATASTRAVWQRSGDRWVAADAFDAERGIARALTVFELDTEGLPAARSDADRAVHTGEGWWTLEDATTWTLGAGRNARRNGPERTRLQVGVGALDPMHLSNEGLTRAIARREQTGVPTTGLRTAFQARRAGALAPALLPAALVLFVLGGPPRLRWGRTLAFALGVSAGYVVLVGMTTTLGSQGVLAPGVAGWLPSAALAALAVALWPRARR